MYGLKKTMGKPSVSDLIIMWVKKKKIWASPPSLQTDVYGCSAMPNYTLPFEKLGSKLANCRTHGDETVVPMHITSFP